MENNDTIKDLFKEKLGDIEVNVRPEIWSSISSQIVSTPTVVGAFTFSVLIKGAVVLSFVAAVGAIIYVSSNKRETPENAVKDLNIKELISPETTKEHPKTIVNTDVKSNLVFKIEQPLSREIDPQEKTKESAIIVEKPNNRNNENEIVQAVMGGEADIENMLEEEQNSETNNSVKPFITEIITTSNSFNKKEFTLDLPNIFTPNNDGINDFLLVNAIGLNEFSLVVLDQRNKIVFTTQDINVSWDGLNLSGEPVSSGNYVYFITARDAAGSVVTKHSVLRIER